ncbi:CvpA family protein [Bacillus sp. FJAT-45037]|uniref:CvpA family protein n=1 Tax=Bacillus sp. FJAT-45037 TaxID=2011007 RepID=UPI000C24F5D3|nr:CvpA family protein [Bacillus sp. FJAT-45037]
MLSFILLLLLLMSFFIGRRRGLVLQVIHLIGFVVSLYVAYSYYQEVASYIQLWIPYPQFSSESTVGMIVNSFNGESVYYSGIAFAMLFFGTKILLHIVGSMLDFVAHLPILRSVNSLFGAIFCFIETYLILFILLFVAALLPVDFVQSQLQGSVVAQSMMNYTPFLSDWIKNLWIQNDLGV